MVVIRWFLSAFIGTAVLLAIPACLHDASGKAYLQWDESMWLYSSTYTSPYQRLLKRFGTFGKSETEQVTVWAWQDFSGNMYFSSDETKPNAKALRLSVENNQTGLYSVNMNWVYGAILVVWLIAFGLSRYVLSKLWVIEEKKKISFFQQFDNNKTKEKKRPPPKKFKASQPSPHNTLGVSPEDSWEDIKKAYKKKISQYHPDKVEQMAPEFKEIAQQKSVELNRAFEVLQKRRKSS